MTHTVLTGMVLHETNTFSTQPTPLTAFENAVLVLGDQVSERFRGTRSGLGAAFEAAERFDWTLRHPVAASATPAGKVTRAAFDTLTDHLLGGVGDGVDGALLFLHGAMVVEDDEDGEGAQLEALRARIGPDVPVVCVLDLHANVTDRMAANANALISFRTYPHVDGYDRMWQGARLLQRAMAGEVRPRCVVARGPQLTGLDGGRTQSVPADSPMLELLGEADRLEAAGDALVVSLQAGFGPADIADAGPSVAVTTDADGAAAEAIARRFMERVWQTRDYDSRRFLPIDEVAARAKAEEAAADRPLIIADYADNPGGGGYGDATALLRGMIEAGLQNAAFHAIRDPDAVRAGLAAGPGADITIDLGGRFDRDRGGAPIPVTGRVIALTDGDYTAHGPMGGGTRRSHGPSMTLRIGGIDIVVVSHTSQTNDLAQFIAMGIDPTKRATLGLKSMQHFRAAFDPIGRDTVLVDSGALCSPSQRSAVYTNLRRPIWPLDPF